MALRFFEGFDTYATTGDLAARWILASSSITLSAGRFGGTGLRLSGGNSAYFARFALGAQPTWIVGTAFRTNSVTSYLRDIMQVRDAGTMQISFRLLTTGAVAATRAGTILAQTAAGLIVPNVWYYCELKTTIHPTTGSYELRVNGQNVLSATNQNTRNTANSSADEVVFADGNGSGPTNDWDDLYACDATGPIHNDFLGDCRVQLLRPSGAGDAADLTLPAGLTAYAAYRNAVLADSPLHFWELQESTGLSGADTGTGTPQTAAFQNTIPRVAGPYSGGYAADVQNGAGALVPYTADLNTTGDLTIECWAYIPATPTDGQAKYVLARGVGGAYTYLLGVNSNTTALTWWQGNGGTQSAATISVGRWVHVAAVRAGSLVTMYLDGVAAAPLSFAGVASTSSTHPVWLGILSNGASMGAGNTQWPGRLAYVALYGAALTVAQLRNHRAFAPFAALDDQGAVGLASDATYVQSATVGHTSLYQLQDPLPATGTVHALQVHAYAKKDDAGLRVVASVVKSGTTTTQGADLYLGTDPRTGVQLLPTNPSTGLAWTVAELQALQAGVRVTG